MPKPARGFVYMLKWGNKMCFYFYLGVFSAVFCWFVFAGLNAYTICNIVKTGLDNIVVAILSIILCNILILALALHTSHTVYCFLGRYRVCEAGIVIQYPLQKPAFFSWDEIVKIDVCDILLGPARKPAIRCSLVQHQDSSKPQPLESYLYNSKSVFVLAYNEERYARMRELWHGDGNG